MTRKYLFKDPPKKFSSTSRATTVRIRPELAARYEARFKNLNQGVFAAVDVFAGLLDSTMPTIRGIFSGDELNLLVDAVGNPMPVSLKHEWGERLPGFITHQACEKWGVDPVPILRKLSALNSMQKIALDVWACKVRSEGKDEFSWASAVDSMRRK